MSLTVRKIKIGKNKATLEVTSYSEFFGSSEEMGKLYYDLKDPYGRHYQDFRLYNTDLWGDAEPHPEDVKQVRDGACYYLGTLRSMASTDEGKKFIKQMVEFNQREHCATVHFFAKVKVNGKDVKIPYDVSVPLNHSYFDEFNDDTYRAGWIAVIQNAYFASLLWATNGYLPTQDDEYKYLKKGEGHELTVEFNYDSVYEDYDKKHEDPTYLKLGSSPEAFISCCIKNYGEDKEAGNAFQKKMVSTYDIRKAAKLLIRQLIDARKNGAAVTFTVTGPHVVSVEDVSEDGMVKYHDQLHDYAGTISVEQLLKERNYIDDEKKIQITDIGICSLKNAAVQRINLSEVREKIDGYFKPLDDESKENIFLNKAGKFLMESMDWNAIFEEDIVRDYLKDKIDTLINNSGRQMFNNFSSVMEEYGYRNMSEANFDEIFNPQNYTISSWLLSYLQKEIQDDNQADKDVAEKLSKYINEKQKIAAGAPKTRTEKIKELSTEKILKENIRRTPDQIAGRIRHFLKPQKKQFKEYTKRRMDLMVGLAKEAPEIYKKEGNYALGYKFMNAVTTNGRDISAGIPQLKILMKYLRSEWHNSDEYDKIIECMTEVEKYCTGKEIIDDTDVKLPILLDEVKKAARVYIDSKGNQINKNICKFEAASTAINLVDEYMREMNVNPTDIKKWTTNQAADGIQFNF